jgi:TonB family protein
VAVAAGVAARRLAAHALPDGGHMAPTWPPTTTQSPTVEASATDHLPWLNGYRLTQLLSGAIAAAVHLVVLFAFNGGEPVKRAVATAAEENIIPMVLPELEPPEVVEVVDTTDAPAAPQLAPPMQMDMPSSIPLSEFVQAMRPTIDPAITSVGAISIPAVAAAGFGAQGGAGVKLFDLKDLDRAPRRLKTVVPTYPHELRRAKISGEVVLMVIIDVNGRVEVERVVSSTARDFETAAVKAAEQCEFEPPLRGGQRVNARYLWRIPFEISER